jgi:ABC-type phosphate transport system substrate-binding protein
VTLITILALWLVAGHAQAQPVGAGSEEVDVVVNKANRLSSLSLEEARKIFLGERSSWTSGKHIAVLMLAAGQAERAVVLRDLYKMTESDYTKYFLRAAFTGRVQAPPKDVSNSSQMKACLAANPEAIGYLRKQDVDDNVKVLLKLP